MNRYNKNNLKTRFLGRHLILSLTIFFILIFNTFISVIRLKHGTFIINKLPWKLHANLKQDAGIGIGIDEEHIQKGEGIGRAWNELTSEWIILEWVGLCPFHSMGTLEYITKLPYFWLKCQHLLVEHFGPQNKVLQIKDLNSVLTCLFPGIRAWLWKLHSHLLDCLLKTDKMVIYQVLACLLPFASTKRNFMTI